jgi:hypothetical protein
MATSGNATSSRVRRVAVDYQQLREIAGRCEALAAAVDNSRAQRLLIVLAGRARGVLAVIDDEPGLHTYLDRLPYCRAVALLTELIRQAHGRIRTVAQREAEGRDLPQLSNAELWKDIEALTARADVLGTTAVQHPPRLGLDTPAGSQALSRRLVDVHQLAKAGRHDRHRPRCGTSSPTSGPRRRHTHHARRQPARTDHRAAHQPRRLVDRLLRPPTPRRGCRTGLTLRPGRGGDS